MKKMKLLSLIVILITAAFVFSGCENMHKTGNRITGGKDVQTFTYCFVVLDGQEIARGAITQWRDYDNSDVVQVLVNGKFYLTHYSNVVLVADPEQGPRTYGNGAWQGVEE